MSSNGQTNVAFYRPYSIRDKVVLITGASAGIGEACAWRFADVGCKLVLVARRTQRLAALKSAILAHYPDARIHLVTLDVRKTKALTKLPTSLPPAFADVDILVNNAGLALGVDVDAEDLACRSHDTARLVPRARYRTRTGPL